MSLIRQSDYEKASKKNNVVSPRRGSHGGIATSKKIRLPTQHKTPNHKCALCQRKDAKKYQLTHKECRWLCPVCLNKYQNKHSTERPHYLKASKLMIT